MISDAFPMKIRLTVIRSPITPISHIHPKIHYVGRRITMVGVLITEKSDETKHGEAMEFITLEDVTALYDATLFPEVYRRCCHLLSPNRLYIVRGLVEENFGVATLAVLDLQPLEPAKENDLTRRARHQCVND